MVDPGTTGVARREHTRAEMAGVVAEVGLWPAALQRDAALGMVRDLAPDASPEALGRTADLVLLRTAARAAQ